MIDAIRGDVQKFTADGTFLLAFSGEGATPGQLDFSMLMLSIDATDHLWIPRGPLLTVDEWDTNGNLVARHDVAGTVEFALGTAFDGSGRMYVIDPVGARVVVFDSSFDVIGQWGERGDGPGQFQHPQTIAVDGAGNAYVSDYATGLHGFELELPGDAAAEAALAASPEATSGMATFLWETASGADSAETSVPGPVAVAPDGTIWLTDSGGSRFHLFTPDGAYIESWGRPGAGEGEFNFAMSTEVGDSYGSIAFAPDGSFYVADTGNRRIQHFSADRQFTSAWGEFGTGDGQFLKPLDVVVDSQGNVFVMDELRSVIQKFSSSGTHMMTFGDSGSADGQFDYPSWMAIDATDSIWIADTGNRRIQQFDTDGQFIAAFDGNGALVEPWEVAVDADGAIYVTDIGAGQVVMLDPSGAVVGVWGDTTDGPGELHFPAMLALDGRGNVFVVDYLSDISWEGRLVVYQLQQTDALPHATPPPN